MRRDAQSSPTRWFQGKSTASRTSRGGTRDARMQDLPGRLPSPGTNSPGGTLRQQNVLADDWAETFAEMIEANILGASLLGGAGHLNRELGEVLSSMSMTTFEGFP